MPEKLLDTSVWVHTNTEPQESCPRVENSKELEVEEDLEVSRSKLDECRRWLVIFHMAINVKIFELSINCVIVVVGRIRYCICIEE